MRTLLTLLAAVASEEKGGRNTIIRDCDLGYKQALLKGVEYDGDNIGRNVDATGICVNYPVGYSFRLASLLWGEAEQAQEAEDTPP